MLTDRGPTYNNVTSLPPPTQPATINNHKTKDAKTTKHNDA